MRAREPLKSTEGRTLNKKRAEVRFLSRSVKQVEPGACLILLLQASECIISVSVKDELFGAV